MNPYKTKMIRQFFLRLFSKPEENIIETNKKLLRKVKYTVEYRGADIWRMKAFEEKTKARVFITIYNSLEDFKDVHEWKFIPEANQNFKIYIDSLYAGTSKGLVRVMLCKLVKMALRKFHERIKISDRICVWACGDGPTNKYKDLIKMYRNMGFQPVATFRNSTKFLLLQQALNDESKFNDIEFMEQLNCDILLEQSIRSLLEWCKHYDDYY